MPHSAKKVYLIHGWAANRHVFDDLIPVFQKNGVRYAESNPELETNAAVQMQRNYFERKHHKTRRAWIKEI